MALRKNEIDELSYDAAAAEAQGKDRDPVSRVASPKDATRRARRLRKAIDVGRPKEFRSDLERDKGAARCAELAADIQKDMLPYDVMMRNPSGAVGRNKRHLKRAKSKICEWKELRQRLEPDSDDPDQSNAEILRPHGTGNMSMAGAQIEGSIYSVPSAKFMENYDQIDFSQKASDLEATVASLEAKIAEIEARPAPSGRQPRQPRQPRTPQPAPSAPSEGGGFQ